MIVLYTFYCYVACSIVQGFFGTSISSINRVLKGRTNREKDITIRNSSLKQYFSTFLEATTISSLSTMLNDGPIPVGEREFLINGWRWHTASVIRDLDRFEKVLIESNRRGRRSDSEMTLAKERIMKSYMFVFDFNWKACMKVERELFFPWLQTLLPPSSSYLFKDVYAKHDIIKSTSGSLRKVCMSFVWDDERNYRTALGLLQELKDCALFIQNAQEKVFVPFVSAYVTKKDQEKFNNRVIRNLGLLDSQVHIVSMNEAIHGNKKEEKLFKSQIPFVARKLIPVWKKRLYLPRTKWLDGSNTYRDVIKTSSVDLEGGFIESDDNFDDDYDENGYEDSRQMQLEEKKFISKYFPE